MLDAQLLTRLERLRFKPRRVHAGLLKGERLSKRKGISIEFADFRPYSIGDDIRHLDWKIFGRLDRPIIKTYRDETGLCVYLLLDDSSSMGFGNPPKWDLAQSLSEALGYIALCGGDVLFPFNLSQTGEPVTPFRGKAMFSRLIYWIRRLKPDGRGITDSLHQFTKSDLPKGIAVLVSDGLDPNFPTALRQISARGHELLLVHILSDADLQPPLEGDLKLLDSETDEPLEITATASVLREYRLRLDNFCDQLDDICRRSGGWSVRVLSNSPINHIIFRQLRRLGVISLP